MPEEANNIRPSSPSADEEYHLTPVDPVAERALAAAREKAARAGEKLSPTWPGPVEVVDPPPRFSVKDLLLLTAFAAVLLSGIQFLPPPWYAGLVGVTAFFALVVLSLSRTRLVILDIGWWIMLGVYLLASIVTAARG